MQLSGVKDGCLTSEVDRFAKAELKIADEVGIPSGHQLYPPQN